MAYQRSGDVGEESNLSPLALVEGEVQVWHGGHLWTGAREEGVSRDRGGGGAGEEEHRGENNPNHSVRLGCILLIS